MVRRGEVNQEREERAIGSTDGSHVRGVWSDGHVTLHPALGRGSPGYALSRQAALAAECRASERRTASRLRAVRALSDA